MWSQEWSCVRREETRSSQGLSTDSLISPWREGEDVPMPYGKSHSFTATWLWHRVKGATLAKVHHCLYQPQFHPLQSLFLKIYLACAKNAGVLWNEVIVVPTSCFSSDNFPSLTQKPRSARPRKLSFVPCNPKLLSIYNQRRKGLNSLFLLWK